MVPPSATVMDRNGDVEYWNRTSDSLVRHQNQRTSREESNNHLLDTEIKELYLRSQSQEEEIIQLRKQIADASTGELRLLNEKHILQRKYSELRMVIYEKQIDDSTDAMRELAKSKDYLEDNLRLANDLKDIDEDIHILTSSLLNLLSENGVRPTVLNASTIGSCTKRLYQDMQWKVRASHGPNYYQYSNDTRLGSSSNQLRFIQEREKMDMKDMNVAISTDVQYRFTNDKAGQVENINSPNILTSESQLYVPTVYETQQSSISDGETPLPGIEGFQIVGEARPGGTLRACGYPTNGNSLCIFQWFRHLQDGTRDSIEGATVPDYVVTADDVDTKISVDCIPMDEQGRQGELVTCFANNQDKITCDPAMQHEIDSHIMAGRAVFIVFLWRDSSEDWVQVHLILKRSGYQIKGYGTDTVVMEEKYSPDLHIKVPPGLSPQLVLICSDGISLPLSTDRTSQPSTAENDIRMRDIIVLTFRGFRAKALDGKRKGKV